MPVFTSKENVKSGVPLGGLGCGKLEVLPNGCLDYFTIQNNWNRPVCNPDDAKGPKALGLLGFHFGIFAEKGGEPAALLLQTEKLAGIPAVGEIRYEGSYPYARLFYHDRRLPLSLRLEAFSPFIPGDRKNSSLPCAVFSFYAENKTPEPMAASLLFVFRNTTGENFIGRFNQPVRGGGLFGIRMGHADPLPHDQSGGEITVSVSDGSGRTTFMNGFNLMKKNLRFDKGVVNLEPFEHFRKNGELPGTDNPSAVECGSTELGSAIAVKFRLGAGRAKRIDFIVAWHFRRHHVGHLYERSFHGAFEAAKYVDKKMPLLKRRTRKFHDTISGSKLPGFLKDGLLNNLYVLSSSTWLGRNGEFSMYEAPVAYPLMGTLDVRFYGSLITALLFPELEKDEMRRFAASMRPDGYVPHDLGYNRLDAPSDGTTNYRWKDLNPKFTLMAYRDFLWTGDTRFLRGIYPHVKKAVDFIAGRDRNGDGLPDNEGADQTFDMWYFYGAGSYCSSIYLASLLAAAKMARLMDDRRFEERVSELFRIGQDGFVRALWNGRFFVASASGGKVYGACTAGQLTGQWYADMLGLGHIVNGDMIKTALRSIVRLNGGDSRFGATNSVYPSGRRDNSSAHSRAVWPGVTYALAALAIYEGMEKDGLGLAEKAWRTFTVINKNPWNQPDVINADNGSYGFGDYYMRNSAIWAVLLALAERNLYSASDLLAKIKA